MQPARVNAFLNYPPLNFFAKQEYRKGDPRMINKIFGPTKEKENLGRKSIRPDVNMDVDGVANESIDEDDSSPGVGIDDVFAVAGMSEKDIGSPTKKFRTDTTAVVNNAHCIKNNVRQSTKTLIDLTKDNDFRSNSRVGGYNWMQRHQHYQPRRRHIAQVPIPNGSELVKSTNVTYDIDRFRMGVVNCSRKIDFNRFPRITSRSASDKKI